MDQPISQCTETGVGTHTFACTAKLLQKLCIVRCAGGFPFTGAHFRFHLNSPLRKRYGLTPFPGTPRLGRRSG